MVDSCTGQFLRLEAVVLIQEVSLMPWQAIRMLISLWIALKLCFQFWSFSQKMQSVYSGLGAASRSWALGLASVYVWEWIRVRIWVHNPLHWWIKYLISMESFQIFFMCFWYQSWPNLSKLSVHEILRFYGENMLQKGIKKTWFSIFVIFYFIKWINSDKNSNK